MIRNHKYKINYLPKCHKYGKIKKLFDLFDSLISLQSFITFCIAVFYLVRE